MKPNTRLSSAVFNLTPTRTRCDLVIIANEKKEKIASGLLNPFLAHLKTAQDQVAKGGYSILLEPETDSDKTWFTKATLERFVRFVSTPEILERVYTIESEILQIEEAIAVQSNNEIGHSTTENHQGKPSGSCKGETSLLNGDDEKAIVLYKPEAQLPEAHESCLEEGNSKVQLLKVLETRKAVLCKEQGMAFARAVAAGFDIDQMEPLVSFAKCFGASRLLEACSRFMHLWKKKHETGQWLEIEDPSVVSSHSGFYAMSTSGIVLSGAPNTYDDSNCGLASENFGKPESDNNPDHSMQTGQPEFAHGQFPHMMFPPWSLHPTPGIAPVLQAYPVQGIPYYQTSTGNGPFYQPSNPPAQYYQHAGQMRCPNADMDNNPESEIWETHRTRSQDDMEIDNEVSHCREPHKRGGHSSKKQSSMVVIKNINYITSKAKKSDTESISASDSETDVRKEDFEAYDDDVVGKDSLKSSRRKGSHPKSTDESYVNDNEVSEFVTEKGNGEWQAFQNCLLRETNEIAANDDIFAMEKDNKEKRRANAAFKDPLTLGRRDLVEIQDTSMNELHTTSGRMSFPARGSGDEVLYSRRDNGFIGRDDEVNMQHTETNGRKILSRGADDFIIGNRGNHLNFGNLSDPLSVEDFENPTNDIDRELSHSLADESFMVPVRSISIDQVGPGDRAPIDMDSEFQSKHQKSDSISDGTRNQVNYEPVELCLMPERGTEMSSTGYDPTLDYEMQVYGEGEESCSKEKKEKLTDIKGRSKKPENDKRTKVPFGSGSKQTGGPIRKGKLSKTSTIEDARARAERLRSYKADLQKIKKEQEEAEQKRLEALKMERQKRIAMRGSSTTAKLPMLSPQSKTSATKLSPISNRGSKFSDSEPGLSSPLQRSKIRTSLGSSESRKPYKTNKLSGSSHLTGDRLSRSVSSLSEPKKENNSLTPDSKSSMARIRRLSEPKKISNHPVTSVNVRSGEAASKRKPFEGPERSKITAIINLDKTKAATLPELKIKTIKAPSDASQTQNKSAVNGPHKLNGAKLSGSSENAEVYVNDPNASNDVEYNPIIEKTVVMLEYEKPSTPILYSSEEKMGLEHQHNDSHETGEKSGTIPEFAAVHAVTLPMDGVDRVPGKFQNQSPAYKVNTNNAEDPSAAANTISSEKPYQAPYARVSPPEVPCTGSSQMVPIVEEASRARVPAVKTLGVQNNPETSQRASVKESSKGLRRLLMFGKKNNSSSAVNKSFESDSAGFLQDDIGTSTAASSSEASTLKNLISQDEPPAGGNASHKSSRHFSLFSPFWSKASEKKLAAN